MDPRVALSFFLALARVSVSDTCDDVLISCEALVAARESVCSDDGETIGNRLVKEVCCKSCRRITGAACSASSPFGIDDAGLAFATEPALKQYGFQCPSEEDQAEVLNKIRQSPPEASLKQQSSLFGAPHAQTVYPGFHIFLNYNLSNVIVVEAPEGLIVVDTADCAHSAQNILADLRSSISQQPIKAIIVTHYHGDHFGGLKTFLNDSPDADLWTHTTTEKQFFVEYAKIRASSFIKAIRQFGLNLPPEILENVGVGPALCLPEGDLAKRPNKLVVQEVQPEVIAGMQVTLLHLPGETDDQLGVYFPDSKSFAGADNFYRAFPNLYTVRGTRPRSVPQWYQTMDRILEYDIERYLTGHTPPILGKDNVVRELTNYRDAMQFTFDQTVRLINKGFHPNVISQSLQLPVSLRGEESLEENYGMLEWSVKGIHDALIGWFSGEPEDLFPLTRPETSKRWLEIIEPDRLLKYAQDALDRGGRSNLQWALELSAIVWHGPFDCASQDVKNKARQLRVDAMLGLAELQPSPNGRNYYLNWILEENCNAPTSKYFQYNQLNIANLPIDLLMNYLPQMYKTEDAADVQFTVSLEFFDINQFWFLILRNSILVVRSEASAVVGADVGVNCTSTEFRFILLGRNAPTESQVSDLDRFTTFLDLLERSVPA